MTFKPCDGLAGINMTGQEDFRAWLAKARWPRTKLEAVMKERIMDVEQEGDSLTFIFDTKELPPEAVRVQLCGWLKECEEYYERTYAAQGKTYREACEAARSKVTVRPTEVRLAEHSKHRH